MNELTCPYGHRIDPQGLKEDWAICPVCGLRFCTGGSQNTKDLMDATYEILGEMHLGDLKEFSLFSF